MNKAIIEIDHALSARRHNGLHAAGLAKGAYISFLRGRKDYTAKSTFDLNYADFDVEGEEGHRNAQRFIMQRIGQSMHNKGYSFICVSYTHLNMPNAVTIWETGYRYRDICWDKLNLTYLFFNSDAEKVRLLNTVNITPRSI